MHTLIRSTLVAAAAATLTPILTAQLHYPGQVPMYTAVLDQPGGYVSGTPKVVVAGQFTDDAIPDAAVLMGNELQFLYAPDRRNSWLSVGTGFVSIARRPQGVSPSMDDILATGPTGLHRVYWNDNTGTWTMTSESLPGTGGFSNATCLQVYHRGGNDYDVVALAASAKFVVRATWNSVTGVLSGTSNVGVDVGSTRMVALQWDADSEPEFASTTGARLRISDHNGALLAQVASTNVGSALARVEMPTGPDRVAWARYNGSDTIMTVVYGTGSEDSVSMFSGALIDSMTTMDVDNGETELLLFSSALPITMALTRGASETFNGWPFAPAIIIDLDRARAIGYEDSDLCDAGTGVFGTTYAPPAHAVADFDGDGDDDLFVAGHANSTGSKRALIYAGSDLDEEADFHDAWRTRAWLPSYSFQRVGDAMQFYFEPPVRPTLSANPASQATHVRIVAWTKAESATYVDRHHAAVEEVEFQNPMEELDLLVPGLSALGTNGEIHLEISYLQYTGGVMTRAFPAYYEDIVLSDYPSQQVYTLVDRVLGPGLDGLPASGSTERPPLQPPASGGGGTTTP